MLASLLVVQDLVSTPPPVPGPARSRPPHVVAAIHRWVGAVLNSVASRWGWDVWPYGLRFRF